MLINTLELWPFGGIDGRKILSTIKIGNIGGTNEFGDYIVTISEDRSIDVKEYRIKNWPREKGAIELLTEILNLHRDSNKPKKRNKNAR